MQGTCIQDYLPGTKMVPPSACGHCTHRNRFAPMDIKINEFLPGARMVGPESRSIVLAKNCNRAHAKKKTRITYLQGKAAETACPSGQRRTKAQGIRFKSGWRICSQHHAAMDCITYIATKPYCHVLTGKTVSGTTDNISSRRVRIYCRLPNQEPDQVAENTIHTHPDGHKSII